MSSDNKNIIERALEVWDNPELDKTKQALEGIKDLSDKALVAGYLEEAKRTLNEELIKLKVPESQRSQLVSAFETRLRVTITDLEKNAISKSPEGQKLSDFATNFLSSFTKDTNLDEVIAKRKADPMNRLIRTGAPIVMAGLMKYLAGEKKEAEGETIQPKTEAAEAEEGETEGGNEEEVVEEIIEPSVGPRPKRTKSGELVVKAPSTGKTPNASPSDSVEPGEALPPGAKPTNVERKGGVKYEPVPDYSKKMTPEQFKEAFKKEPDRHKRHMMALQQVALGNVPAHFNQFEDMKVLGKNGTTVEFQASRHYQRIGTDSDYIEVPFDGPTAAAAAQIQGCTLATPWVVNELYKRAQATGGKIPFFGSDAVAKAHGVAGWDPNHPDGNWMMSPEFVIERNKMLEKYYKGKEDKITVEGSKNVGLPRLADLKRGTLNMQGGRDPFGNLIQGYSNGFHENGYSDHTHGAIMVREGTFKVNGKPMTLAQFHANPKLAKEFGFQVTKLGNSYQLTPVLQSFVDANKQKNAKPGEKPTAPPPTAVAAATPKPPTKPT